jgi:TIR domain
MRKIFISHSSKDKELADSIQMLIETGIGLPHNEVFCTSLDGLGIPVGVPDFKEYIRKEMQDCDTVVALISRNYYDSPFCMCELGAVWVQAKNFFPILVPLGCGVDEGISRGRIRFCATSDEALRVMQGRLRRPGKWHRASGD